MLYMSIKSESKDNRNKESKYEIMKSQVLNQMSNTSIKYKYQIK